jgi:hypothetical protein
MAVTRVFKGFMNKERTITLALVILAAAASRLLPHPQNVAPIAAIALFAGAQFEKKWLAFMVPLTAMLLSDLVIGFHNTLLSVYAAFVLIVCLGFTLGGKEKILPIAATTLAASILFFVLTNIGVWATGELYPLTGEGLLACFAAAIPFFTHTVLGDLFYSALLFGGFIFAERKYPHLQIHALATA